MTDGQGMTPTGPQKTLAVFNPPPGRSGQPIPVSATSVRIGQGPQNDVVLDDDTVSTSHARLDYADGAWRLTDLESRNGTFVNGERLPSGGTVPLDEDAPVGFGAVKLLFAAGGAHAIPDPEVIARPIPTGTPVVPLAARPGFRLPVWVLLLIIVIIAVIVMVVLWVGNGVQPAAATIGDSAIRLAFQVAGSAP